MQDHFQLSDAEFEVRFKDCALNPERFSHEAHLRLAWIHINRYGLKQAEINIQHQLKNYVKFVGAEDKYNTTLTLAAIKTVFHFMNTSTSDNFKDFITEFPRLNTNFKDLMACHYSQDIYTSKKAKQQFLEPDLLGFDFKFNNYSL